LKGNIDSRPPLAFRGPTANGRWMEREVSDFTGLNENRIYKGEPEGYLRRKRERGGEREGGKVGGREGITLNFENILLI
jgi:hypothetical protein